VTVIKPSSVPPSNSSSTKNSLQSRVVGLSSILLTLSQEYLSGHEDGTTLNGVMKVLS